MKAGFFGSTSVGFQKTLDDIWMIYPGKLSLKKFGGIKRSS